MKTAEPSLNIARSTASANDAGSRGSGTRGGRGLDRHAVGRGMQAIVTRVGRTSRLKFFSMQRKARTMKSALLRGFAYTSSIASLLLAPLMPTVMAAGNEGYPGGESATTYVMYVDDESAWNDFTLVLEDDTLVDVLNLYGEPLGITGDDLPEIWLVPTEPAPPAMGLGYGEYLVVDVDGATGFIEIGPAAPGEISLVYMDLDGDIVRSGVIDAGMGEQAQVDAGLGLLLVLAVGLFTALLVAIYSSCSHTATVRLAMCEHITDECEAITGGPCSVTTNDRTDCGFCCTVVDGSGNTYSSVGPCHPRNLPAPPPMTPPACG